VKPAAWSLCQCTGRLIGTGFLQTRQRMVSEIHWFKFVAGVPLPCLLTLWTLRLGPFVGALLVCFATAPRLAPQQHSPSLADSRVVGRAKRILSPQSPLLQWFCGNSAFTVTNTQLLKMTDAVQIRSSHVLRHLILSLKSCPAPPTVAATCATARSCLLHVHLTIRFHHLVGILVVASPRFP
jgi:hypothetical protein